MARETGPAVASVCVEATTASGKVGIFGRYGRRGCLVGHAETAGRRATDPSSDEVRSA